MFPIFTHRGDLPDSVSFSKSVSIDTEAMGLLLRRDRLCLVQICMDEKTHLIQVDPKIRPKNLIHLLEDDSILKIFHYARFDMTLLMHTFDIDVNNVYCTKIASKLCRTYTNKHGLKDLCKDLLNIELSKEEQTSDWGADFLTDNQKKYAATDVIYLSALRAKLDDMLDREHRSDLAQSCFNFLKTRAKLDILSGEQFDIFSHKGDV